MHNCVVQAVASFQLGIKEELSTESLIHVRLISITRIYFPFKRCIQLSARGVLK